MARVQSLLRLAAVRVLFRFSADGPVPEVQTGAPAPGEDHVHGGSVDAQVAADVGRAPQRFTRRAIIRRSVWVQVRCGLKRLYMPAVTCSR